MSDPWSFKYYKYDERGRVIRMWIAIHGLDVKKIDYSYNSQDQVTNLTVLAGDDEARMFRYRYDIPGRLAFLDIPDNPAETTPPVEGELENPVLYFNLARYLYNANSLIESLKLNNESINSNYTYNERNWIFQCDNEQGLLNYIMSYFPNGNVQWLELNGSYRDNFTDNNPISFYFSYDKSNRLLNAVTGINSNNYALKNTYDRDGNILTLKRYAHEGTIQDNFNYEYYSGTNKLKKVSIQFADFTYDHNGNLKSDDMNKNIEINYDHRNLIKDMKHWEYRSEGQIITSRIYYFYDEAGNRIRKLIFKSYFPDPVDPTVEDISGYPQYEEEDFESAANDYFSKQGNGGSGPVSDPPAEGDNPIQWYLAANEFYIRGVEGNELVIFNGNNVSKYNFFGGGNEGYIDVSDRKHYYLKDHLGSVRAVVDQDRSIISAQDYDMWGYLMQGRSYDANIAKYKFTGKERDKESNYDYFGARYYDARIGRWGGVDNMLEKHFDFTPYNYVLNNTYIFIDRDGRQVGVYADPWTGGGLGAIGGGIIIISSGMVLYELYPGTLVLVNEIEEIVITDTQSKDWNKDITSQVRQIEKHIDKIEGIPPNDPDPHKKRKKWIQDIKNAIKRAAEDFKHKVKNKRDRSYDDLWKIVKDLIGEERAKRITEFIEKEGISIKEIVEDIMKGIK